MAKRQKKQIQVYAFIDTNIFLDFYRANNEVTLKLLERLEPVAHRVISTYQVEMEFLKNRQAVLLQTVAQQLKSPATPALPAILTTSATSGALKTATKDASEKISRLRSRVESLLERPAQSDRVYKALNSIFQSESDHVLTRDMPIRHVIKRKALRRFLLGYPPRKSTDTSYGDALNWEWIVHCSENFPGKLIIVTRDSDYGVSFNKEYYLNDQLHQEFRDRVGKKSISITQRLSDALKELQIHVPDEEVEAETKALEQNEATDYSEATESVRLLSARLKSILEMYVREPDA